MSMKRVRCRGGRGRVACVLAMLALAALAADDGFAFAKGERGARSAHADRRGHDGRSGHAARTVSGTDVAHLHLVHQNEAQLYETGFASGALPGQMKAKLTIGSMFKGTCTIHTAHGSITGRGIAKPHGLGRYQSFSGTFAVTSGSGLYKRIHGEMRLYGTFDRRTFAVVVKTQGRLSY